MNDTESETTRARRKVEVRLLIVGIIISASYMTSIVFATLGNLASMNWIPLNAYEMYAWYYRMFDIFTMCNPYVLLILSEVTRKAFLSFIVCATVQNTRVANERDSSRFGGQKIDSDLYRGVAG